MKVRVIIDKPGEGSNPLEIEDNYKCLKQFNLDVYTHHQFEELLGFITAGVNAYEDWFAENYSRKE